jgi:hypothetical protein
MVEQPYFDVFLAHNSQDKPQVRAIKAQLRRRGLMSWIDEDQIRAGTPFQDEIQQAIPNVKSAAIFIGLKGLGQWQAEEVRALLEECKKADKPLIPVLLPEADEIPKDLRFLGQRNWVSFANGINDREALYRLECAIKKEKPTSPPNISGHFDVWLCYNEEDFLEVEQIGKKLKEASIQPWLDKWELRFEMWEPFLEKLIKQKRIKSVAVFIGSNGGPWQKNYMQLFLWALVKQDCPIIPVILKNSLQEPEDFPLYLERTGTVDFRQDNPDPMSQLIEGIPFVNT